MELIIPPVNRQLLIKELTPERFIRKTNYGNNEIYVITHHDSPNLMKEIGRLRELSFREAGGGTGKSIDIDDFDISDNPYQQLLVWDPSHQEILGGYRYFDCTRMKVDSKSHLHLATTELFNFSDQFMSEYFPYMVELGRSFVQPEYQASKIGRKGLFALDNLWDGLAAIVKHTPNLKYFFGKVTMYTHYNQRARDFLLYFMHKNFPDVDKLVVPIHPLKLETSEIELQTIMSKATYAENYKLLNQKVRELNENIPPLINSYMNLSPTMKMFGTSVNHEFGGVEETGILVKIDDIYESKKHRHITSYQP